MSSQRFRADGNSRQSIGLTSRVWTSSGILWNSAAATTEPEAGRDSSASVMHRILAITNQKGGVGKTTTSVNLAASLAATKRRVLLVDIDPQGNATMGCGVDKRALERSTTDVLLGDADAASTLVGVEYADFRLMPANQDLVAAEVELMGKPGCESRLRDALRPIRDQFDVVLIDCPPSLNMLTVNALVAADEVLIPMQCEYYALE